MIRLRAQSGSAAWVVGVLLLLGGLFGMHGLADHGAASMSSMPAMSSMSSMSSMSAGMDHVLGDAAMGADHIVASPSSPAHEMSGMGMCVVVLAAGLLLLVAAAFVVRRHVHDPRHPGRTSLVLKARSRHRSPPSLTALSIARC